jgi:1-acyl-sn-glycerol-3-phosphate acyltransferase
LISASMNQAWCLLVKGYLKVWHRFTVYGAENLPRESPFLLVANHTSHLDTLALAAAIPWYLRSKVFPLAAGDTFFDSTWSSGAAAGFLNALPVWRKRPAGGTFQVLRKRLLLGTCGYILFPEGTRSRDGQMVPFKGGIGMLVAGTDVPVIPCYLSGCFEAFPAGSKRPRRKRIELLVGTAIRFAEVSNDKTGWESIARQLEDAVRGLKKVIC